MSEFIDMMRKQASELHGARTQQVYAELNPEMAQIASAPPSFWAQKSVFDTQSANLYGLGSKSLAHNLYADKNLHTGEVNINPLAK